MRLTYKGGWYKSGSVLRYLLARLRYPRSFRCARLSMIGTSCGIHIFSGGLLDCAGRIIVDDQVMLYTKGILRIGKQFGINKFSRIVAKDVPSGVVIGGVPFKILKNI